VEAHRDTGRQAAEVGGLSRREALGRLAGGGVMAALLWTTGPNHAQAQGTPMPPREEANHLVLSGAGTRIAYDSTSETGAPLLSYEGPFGNLDFAGDEIQESMCEPLGRLVSVIVQQRPDADVTWLTLLLPSINMPGGNDPTPFATLAVLTTHLTTIAGPDLIEGALQTYEALTLEGTAQLVMP
jgi:hypothetical protein